MLRTAFALLLTLFAAAAPIAAFATPSLAPVEAATSWIGHPATAASLAGKVVILDIFTVDCINCQNVVPTLRKLYADDRAKGLRIVGIHAPETPAEQQRPYVVANMHAQGIVWPVAIDNSFALWRRYGAQAWPTQLFFDRHGRLRQVIVGDSQDDRVRRIVRQLLAER